MFIKISGWKHMWLHEDGSVDVVPDGNHINYVYENADLGKFHITDDDYIIVQDVIDNNKPSDDAMKRLLEHNYRIGVFGNEFYIESKAVDTRTLKFLQQNIPMNEIGSVSNVSWDAPFMTTSPIKTSLDEFLNAKSVRDLTMNTFANLLESINQFQKDATLLKRNNSVDELRLWLKARDLSDEEIEKSYEGYTISEFKLNPSGSSGFIAIDFPHRESVVDNFIIYDDGRIAFDNWYPEKMYVELVSYIKDKIDISEKKSSVNIQAGIKEKIVDLVKNVFGDWDTVVTAIEDYKTTEGDKEAKAESADKFPGEIDFSFYEGPDLRFNSATSEYELLNQLEDDAWIEYLDEMARYGVSVDYDTIEDEFVVSVSLDKDAGIVDKAKVWLMITLIASLLGTTASEVLADPITMVNQTITTVEGEVTRVYTEGKIDKIDRYEDKMVFHFYSPADSQTKKNLAEAYLKYQKAIRGVHNFNFMEEGQGTVIYSIS